MTRFNRQIDEYELEQNKNIPTAISYIGLSYRYVSNLLNKLHNYIGYTSIKRTRLLFGRLSTSFVT